MVIKWKEILRDPLHTQTKKWEIYIIYYEYEKINQYQESTSALIHLYQYRSNSLGDSSGIDSGTINIRVYTCISAFQCVGVSVCVCQIVCLHVYVCNLCMHTNCTCVVVPSWFKDNMEYLQHDYMLTWTTFEPFILCLSCNKWSCDTYQKCWKEWKALIQQRCYRESTCCQST